VLWRHQQLLQKFVLLEPTRSLFRANRFDALIRLIRQIRPRRFVLALQPMLHWLSRSPTTGARKTVTSTYSAILTLAHGLAWIEAMKLSDATGLPLITIFHDWYPDSTGCPSALTGVWDHWFRLLYRRSSLAFCVSEGMIRELGPHPNVHLLPPIPDPLAKSAPKVLHSISAKRIRLYYSGFAGGLYRPMLEELIKAVYRDLRFSLHISGSETDGLRPLADGVQIQVSGFLDGSEWQQAFDEADALLLVLSFDAHKQRHLRTHFPSKLVEYANRGRPLAIWGPAESTAVQWARNSAKILVCTEPNAEEFLRQVGVWFADRVASRYVALDERNPQLAFDPAGIQCIFEREILAVMG
jgi:hypothetical protein